MPSAKKRSRNVGSRKRSASISPDEAAKETLRRTSTLYLIQQAVDLATAAYKAARRRTGSKASPAGNDPPDFAEIISTLDISLEECQRRTAWSAFIAIISRLIERRRVPPEIPDGYGGADDYLESVAAESTEAQIIAENELPDGGFTPYLIRQFLQDQEWGFRCRHYNNFPTIEDATKCTRRDFVRFLDRIVSYCRQPQNAKLVEASGESSNGSPTQDGFTPVEFRAMLVMSGKTLNKHIRAAGVTPALRGKKNHRYTREESAQILRHVASSPAIPESMKAAAISAISKMGISEFNGKIGI